MNFGQALGHLQAGKRIAREGWDASGQFLYLVPGSEFKVNRAPLLGIYPEGTPLTYHAHIDLSGHYEDGGRWARVWDVSQADMLAADWKLAAGEVAPAAPANWRSIDTYIGAWPVALRAPELIDAKLNPSGETGACSIRGDRWYAARWNEAESRFDTIQVNPTQWRPLA